MIIDKTKHVYSKKNILFIIIIFGDTEIIQTQFRDHAFALSNQYCYHYSMTMNCYHFDFPPPLLSKYIITSSEVDSVTCGKPHV